MSYVKIDKQKARRLYEQHRDFIMVPSHLRPDCFVAAVITSCNFFYPAGVSFNQLVNAFSYYNCTTSETGRRVAFYIKAK